MFEDVPHQEYVVRLVGIIKINRNSLKYTQLILGLLNRRDPPQTTQQ